MKTKEILHTFLEITGCAARTSSNSRSNWRSNRGAACGGGKARASLYRHGGGQDSI